MYNPLSTTRSKIERRITMCQCVDYEKSLFDYADEGR